MKRFILFNVFIISLTLWTALDRSLAVSYFADRRGDAGLFWWGSVLLLIVFAVGMYQLRKAEAVGQGEPSPSDKASGVLLISSLFFGIAAALHIESVIERMSAPQVPLALKFGFGILTIINLGAWLWWTADNYREWRNRQKGSISAA